jgi:putative flippase GtrA
MPAHRFLRRPAANGSLLHWLHTFVLHVMTGFLAVAAHYATMYALLRTGLQAVPASTAGFAAGALTRFALSYWHIFEPSRGVRVASVRFIIVIAIQMVANSALLALLLDQGVGLWPAQVTTTIALTFVNYLAYRLWVFR